VLLLLLLESEVEEEWEWEAQGRLRIRMEGCCVNAAWGGRCVEGDLVRMSAGIGCWVLVFLEEG